MEVHNLRVDLRYATIVRGVLCVMISGVVPMPMLLADNWDFLEQVDVNTH